MMPVLSTLERNREKVNLVLDQAGLLGCRQALTGTMMCNIMEIIPHNPECIIPFILEKHSLSQQSLSKKLQCSQAYLSDLIHRRRKLTPKIVSKLEALFPEEEPNIWKTIHVTCARREGWKI